MKKIFLVSVEHYSYDEYDAMVVIADNEQEAIEMCKEKDYDNTKSHGWGDGFFKDQGKITAEEISLNTSESDIILKSFNAG